MVHWRCVLKPALNCCTRYLSAAEIYSNNPFSKANEKSLKDNDVPCAVCYVPSRTSTNCHVHLCGRKNTRAICWHNTMATEAEQPTFVWTTILKLSKAERPAERGHCSPTPRLTAALCLVPATSTDGKSRASCAADNHIYHC